MFTKTCTGNKYHSVFVAVFIAMVLGEAKIHAQTCSSPLTINTPSVTHASCPGNGQVTVTSVSPSAASIAPDFYEYALWDTLGTNEIKPYQSSNVLTNLQPGVYDIRVRRVCTSPAGFSSFITRRVTVNNTESMPIINNITLRRPDVCGNGRFDVSAVPGGSGPLEYALVPTLTEPEPVSSYVRGKQASNIFDSLTAGTYYVRVYNNCGNAVTQAMTVPAFTGTPTFTGIEFAPLGCDSVWFRFNMHTYVNYNISIDSSISRVWVNWPDGSTDSARLNSSQIGNQGSGNVFMFTAHISKIDPSYNAALNYWQNISNFPFTINFGFKDMCSNMYDSSYTVHESQSRHISVNLSETDPLTTCDSVAYRWRIQYTRTSPGQTLYHTFRNMHSFMYSIDTGATWVQSRASNALPANSSLNYSDYFALPRTATLLMVVMCGDTLSTVVNPPAIPVLNSTVSENNLRACLGNSGIGMARQNSTGNPLGIEMLSAPAGQDLVPYFEYTFTSGASNVNYPVQLANLALGTYIIRIWDTIDVDCPRFIDRTINLTHPAELDFDMDFACNGNMNVFTANTYRFSTINSALGGNFRVKIFDATGTTQLLGGANGYVGNTTSLPGYTSAPVPAAAVAGLPDGNYIVRAYKYQINYPYLNTDTCTMVQKVWTKQPNNLNLVPIKFIPGCPGSTGAIVAMVAGGKAPYAYTLFDPLSNIVPPTIPGGNIYDDLDANATYTLQVIDSCGTVVNRGMSIGESLVIFIANTTTMPCPNDDVTLFVDNMPGVGYQWYKNGVPMSGETGHELTLLNIQNPADSGEYAVEIEIGDCVVMLSSFLLDPDECGTPLPVQLKSFTAYNRNKSAHLVWETVSEINSKGFGIERSTDGKIWNNIGFVASLAENGKSVEMLTYSFTDKNIQAPVYYYRLRQTDIDGKISYSSVHMVRFDQVRSFNLDIYPNPATDIIYIEGLTGDEDITIADMTGKVLGKIKAQAGKNDIGISGLPSGVYYLEAADSRGNVSRSKLSVVRR